MTGTKYLLDTHCLVWFQKNNPKIPSPIYDIIENTNNLILFSQISLFELAIKIKVGKLPDFKVSIEDVYEQALKDGFVFVSVLNAHLSIYGNIPLFENHRDPFDRLLIATAMEEKAIILSADEKFKLYNDQVKTIW